MKCDISQPITRIFKQKPNMTLHAMNQKIFDSPFKVWIGVTGLPEPGDFWHGVAKCSAGELLRLALGDGPWLHCYQVILKNHWLH